MKEGTMNDAVIALIQDSVKEQAFGMSAILQGNQVGYFFIMGSVTDPMGQEHKLHCFIMDDELAHKVHAWITKEGMKSIKAFGKTDPN